jgi:hypothetical protein
MPTKKATEAETFRVGRARTGLGLFATTQIKKGEFVAEYWGKRIPSSQADTMNTKYLFDLNSRWTIDGADRRNLARYINHACRPNTKAHIMRGTIKIYATKTIRPGDEITYHYGRGYFERFLEPKGCKCAHCDAKAPRSRAKRTNGAATGKPAKRAPRNGARRGH